MVVGDAYKSICRDNRSRRAYDDSPRDDDGVARNGFGGGGGGGAAPQRLKRGLEAIDRPERHPVFLQA